MPLVLNMHNDKDDKISCGIEFFYFVKSQYGNDQLRICRRDKSTIDCSYMYSWITQKNKTVIDKSNLNHALRNAITDQRLEFFEKQNILRCCICNNSSSDKYEIDHIIPFHHIKSEFLKKIDSSIIPTEFDDDINGTCSRILKEVDKDFKEKWQSFHKEMATYQVLSKACNRKKSGKYINE